MAPNITEYSNPITELRPSEMAPNAARQTGAAQKSADDSVGVAIGGAIGKIGDFLTKRDELASQNEISAGMAAYATMQLNQSDGWDNVLSKSDLNDTTVRSSYLDQKSKEWDDFVSSFQTTKGRQWAETKVAEAKLQLSKVTAQDMSVRAGAAAVSNIHTYGQSTADFAYRNPEQLDALLAGVDKDFPTLFPSGIDPANAANAKAIAGGADQIKTEVTKHAIEGMIEKNPDDVIAKFNSGYFDKYAKAGIIDPTTYSNILKGAQAQISFNAQKQKAADVAQKEKDTAEAKKAESSLYNSTFGPNGQQSVTPGYFDGVKHYMSLPGADPATGKVMYDYGVAIRDKKLPDGTGLAKNDDPATVAGLNARIDAKDNPLTKEEVQRAVLDGKLTVAHADQYMKHIDIVDPKTGKNPLVDPVDRQMYDRALSLLTIPKDPVTGYPLQNDPKTGRPYTPEQRAAVDDYETWFRSSFDNGIAAGLTARQLTDPNDPNYLPRRYPGPDPDKQIAAPKYAPLTFNQGVPNPPGATSAGGAPAPALSDDQVNQMIFGPGSALQGGGAAKPAQAAPAAPASTPPTAPGNTPTGVPGPAKVPLPPGFRAPGVIGAPPPNSPSGFKPLSYNGSVGAAIENAGFRPDFMTAVAHIESGGNPNNTTGGYKGLFQLSAAEFKEGGGGDIFNPKDNARAAAFQMQKHASAFVSRYGRQPSDTELYLMHQQGEAGLFAHLEHPTQAAWRSMLGTGEGQQKGAAWAKAAIWGNIPANIRKRFPGGVDTVTSADFIAIWQEKVDSFEGKAGVRV